MNHCSLEVPAATLHFEGSLQRAAKDMTSFVLAPSTDAEAELKLCITRPLAEGSSADIYLDNDLVELLPLYERFLRRATSAYGGRNRNVFHLGGNLVVKLPRNYDGFCDNDWEGSISNSAESLGHPHYVQYPRTRLAYYNNEVPVIWMEYVEYASSTRLIEEFGEVPDWVYSVDCGQVGFTRRGRLVAFDYGRR
jgi:hypothetical protein